MPTIRSPRKGSMQFWPRKKAKNIIARIRSWAKQKDAKALGFAGYKVGMTHVMATDNRPNSLSKGEDIMWPVTIIECPPIKVAGVVFYSSDAYGLHASSHIFAEKLDKELGKKISVPKNLKKKIQDIKPEDYADMRLIVYTQPKMTFIGKKKPELFELGIGGGDIKAKFEYAKNILGKEVKLQDVFAEGQQIDVHAVTKGKGYQGPVKRFNVSIRRHKSEKTKRGPGSLGPWHGTNYYRVAHAGQTGFHQRVDYNKWILRIGEKPAEINAKGGFLRYGTVKNTYMLVKGSIPGPAKRMIKLTHAIRPNKKIISQAPSIAHVNLESKQ